MQTISKKGFTLVELLVVISIISFLSSIVLASLASARDKARLAAGKQFNANLQHTIGDRSVGDWNFDECSSTTVNDFSGSNNNGTVSSSMWSTDTPTGKGCSLLFNGSQYLSTSVFNMPAIDASKTISFWVKYNGTPSGQQNMVNLVAPGGATQIGFFGDGKFKVWMYGGSAILTLPSYFSAGVWHHIAYTYDSTTNVHILYVDGAEMVRGTLSNIQSGTVTVANIGGSQNGWGNFNGYIDDVHIYASSMTSMAILQQYALEKRIHTLLSKAN